MGVCVSAFKIFGMIHDIYLYSPRLHMLDKRADKRAFFITYARHRNICMLFDLVCYSVTCSSEQVSCVASVTDLLMYQHHKALPCHKIHGSLHASRICMPYCLSE